MQAMLPEIKSQTAEELQARFQEWNQPTYRVSQLLDWLYVHRVTDWDAMTNLPRALRDKLRSEYELHSLELVQKQVSRDTPQKFLWRLTDQSLVESVLTPASPSLYGEPSDRHTLCVSTQVGCAYGCKFCASGLEGWKRNLGPEEIIEQVLAVERWHAAATTPGTQAGVTPGRSSSSERLINNLVIMGAGEPLQNYQPLLGASTILSAPGGGGLGPRKTTTSPSGLPPQIPQRADEP